MPKFKFVIQIDTGKRTPISITGYYFGQDKAVSFKTGKTYTKTQVLGAVIKVIEESFVEAGHEVVKPERHTIK